ncbi:hypothetical protein TWF102_007970 [Orbilia oligospora]|uniref:HNH nuclease domain-containing protein n=1 Tax=Orbilia oligospora TaxID=2813651 RepID=A0A7C8J6M9_ORBOL|nr:hypothetical protein TWF102_007970 [Orbilia oligospora]
MPRDSQLRRALSRAASRLKIRQDPPKRSISHTSRNLVFASTPSQRREGKLILPNEAGSSGNFEGDSSTNLKYSVCGYPGAVCLKVATTSLVNLFSPWDPADIRFFAGVRNPSTVAALSRRTHRMCLSQQLRILSSASVIRGPGGERSSEEQKAFRAAIIARYALGHPKNSHAVRNKDRQYRCQITNIHFRSDRVKASHICPYSKDRIASLISLSSTMAKSNGLLLHASVKKNLDNFRITIIPKMKIGIEFLF